MDSRVLSATTMAKSKPPEVRHLEQLLQEKLIPWAQSSAAMVLFDAPPRSSKLLEMQEYSRPLSTLRSTEKYPQIFRWREERLNAVSVMMLGCVFEGEAHYRVHAPLGSDEREWIVPVEQGTFFAIAPNIPFSDGSRVAWEYPTENAPTLRAAFSRGVLLTMRRDGVSCRTFTCDKGKLWVHPYVFLYQPEAWLLGEKLLAEMRTLSATANAISSLYWQLILRLLLRAIERDEYSELKSLTETPQLMGHHEPIRRLHPERIVHTATEYIQVHLNDPELSSRIVAQYAGLSERHLNRLFQEELEMSIFQYIQQGRIEKSRDLLMHSGITIGEVAKYCGFRRLSAFSGWFARQHGSTPSEYRAHQISKVRNK